MTTNSEFSSFYGLLRESLGSRIDAGAETLLDMVAEDVSFEFPYAPPGAVQRLSGKAALHRYLGQISALLELGRLELVAAHHVDDGATVVVQFTAEGRGVATGKPYPQSYISVIRVESGRIVRYQDYWNPLVVLDALGADALRSLRAEAEA